MTFDYYFKFKFQFRSIKMKLCSRDNYNPLKKNTYHTSGNYATVIRCQHFSQFWVKGQGWLRVRVIAEIKHATPSNFGAFQEMLNEFWSFFN